MDNLVSFVLGGVILIIIYLSYQTLRNPNLLSIFFKLKFTNLKKIIPQLIILILFSTILSFVIFLNTSYANDASNQVTLHLGPTDSVIYLRDKNSSFSESKAAELFSESSKYYDKYLPISILQIDEIQSNGNQLNNIIFVNYNLLTSQTYLKSDNFELFDQNQTIISESLSKKFGINSGDTISFSYKNKNYDLRIDKVVSDNGLIGYDFTVPSRLEQFKGSIYIPQSKFLEITGYSNESPYNQILLQSLDDRFTNDANNEIEQNLISKDKKLVLENVKLPYLQRILGNFEGLNISQIILLLFIIPAITLIILQLYFDKKYLNDSESKIGTLKIQGFSDKQVQGILNYLILYKSLLSSTLGLIIGLILVHTIGNNNFFEAFGLKNLPKISFDFNNILFTFSSIFIVTYLINNIWSYWNSAILIKLKYFYQINSQKVFSLRNNSLILMVLFATIIAIYYFNSSFVENTQLRFIGNFYTIQVAVTVICYFAARYFIKSSKIISRTSSLLLLILNILPLTLLKESFSFNPYLLVFTWIILAYNVTIAYLILFDISIKSFQFTGLRIPKNFISASGFIDRFRNSVLLFMIILEFFLLIFIFSNYIQTEVSQAKNTQTNAYDIYITDTKGVTNPENIDKIVEKHTSIRSQSFLANSNAIFENLSVKDLDHFSEEKYPDLDPNTQLKDYVGFVSNDAFNESSFTNQNDFFSSQKYFLLTDNYDVKDGLSLKINNGDELTFNINGISISRKFLGYINSSKDLPNGVYLSELDYNLLHKSNNLNIEQNYAYKIDGAIANPKQLENELLKSGITSILIRDDLVNGTLTLISKILVILEFFLALTFVLVIVICQFISSNLMFNVKSNYSNFSQIKFFMPRYTFFNAFLIIMIILTTINYFIIPPILNLVHVNIISNLIPNTNFEFNIFSIFELSILLLFIAFIVNTVLRKTYEK